MILKQSTTLSAILISALLLFHHIPSAFSHSEENHNDDSTTVDVDCSSYTNTINLSNGGKIHYVSTNTTISLKLSSPSTLANGGYLALGFSDDGTMGGSEVVVGNDSGVSLYALSSRSGMRIVEDDRQQALLNSSFVRDGNDGNDVLEYKKLLNDGTGNRVIDGADAENIFIWAIGTNDNFFFGHGINRGHVTVTLSPCIESSSGGGGGGGITIEKKNHKELFIMHGIFAILAFAVFMPIAITVAAARNLFSSKSDDQDQNQDQHGSSPSVLWFKIHTYTMGVAFVMSIVVLALAVYAVKQKGTEHFHNAHEIIGLVVIILTTVQVVFAVVRPAAPHAQAKIKDPNTTVDTDFEINEKKNDDDDSKDLEKTLVRSVWEKSHRLLALIIMVGALYQIHSGLVLYRDIYVTKDYVHIFWIVAAVLAVILASVVFYSQKIRS